MQKDYQMIQNKRVKNHMPPWLFNIPIYESIRNTCSDIVRFYTEILCHDAVWMAKNPDNLQQDATRYIYIKNQSSNCT